MRTGAEFVEILDNYLKEKKITRKQFCTLVDIPPSTVATWKSKNSLPPIDLLSKIASFMHVSLSWLVNNELFESVVSITNICSYLSVGLLILFMVYIRNKGDFYV